jgi:hypothetical protein
LGFCCPLGTPNPKIGFIMRITESLSNFLWRDKASPQKI